MAIPRRHNRPLGPEHAALADAVSYLMARHSLKPEELAKRSGVSPRNVYNVLNCSHSPSLSTIERLATALDASPWQLVITNVPPSVGTSAEIERLLVAYNRVSPKVREYLLSVVTFEHNTP